MFGTPCRWMVDAVGHLIQWVELLTNGVGRERPVEVLGNFFCF